MNKKHNITAIAFDFGMRRIGVAVGQTETATTTPLVTLKAQDGEPCWQEITELFATWRPDVLVVGTPLNLNGTEQTITKHARLFASKLKKRYNLPVDEVDERFTTKAAREEIYSYGGYKALQQTAIDSIAAKLILEDWMRQHNY